jgi:hypothetical protein
MSHQVLVESLDYRLAHVGFYAHRDVSETTKPSAVWTPDLSAACHVFVKVQDDSTLNSVDCFEHCPGSPENKTGLCKGRALWLNKILWSQDALFLSL